MVLALLSSAMNLLWVLGVSVLASVGAVGAAALFLWLPERVRRSLLPMLISFATGTLLASCAPGAAATRDCRGRSRGKPASPTRLTRLILSVRAPTPVAALPRAGTLRRASIGWCPDFDWGWAAQLRETASPSPRDFLSPFQLASPRAWRSYPMRSLKKWVTSAFPWKAASPENGPCS